MDKLLSKENVQKDHEDKIGSKELSYTSVKSTAVVKYSAVQSPASFALLQCNTNLNLPPSNWLSSYAESYGLQHVLRDSSGFSSFRMADMFPDCVGNVDVVSDAENIKKLLKLPYSGDPVSMVVHRVKETLLIDDFDIHKYLFRKEGNDWTWLRKLIFEKAFPAPEDTRNCITNESKCRYALQQENLVSKFLHHSLSDVKEKKSKVKKKPPSTKTNSKKQAYPPLPEPNLQDALPDHSEHTFARNVMWTFENIEMLVGSDMPIFGGAIHPCISLRLRDLSKPISVLTGIDYWLDNLMCNVPEVAMCYHAGGIVQHYDLIKTDELPYMEGSKFSPNLIRDVAQNILAFLKSSVTKAGHTYWLIKAKDDGLVKLYDLTSLCSSTLADKVENPFTIPVALLLYRVARNMKHNHVISTFSNLATVRNLLNNCIRLLPKERYPEIVTSAHYMISDSLVPLNTDPTAPDLGVKNDRTSKNKMSPHRTIDHDGIESVDVKTLCVARQGKTSIPLYDTYNDEESEMMDDVIARCKVAILHIIDGFKCLQYFEDASNAKEQSKQKGDIQEPKMANQAEPIALPYEKIHSTAATEKHKKVDNNKDRKKNKVKDKGKTKKKTDTETEKLQKNKTDVSGKKKRNSKDKLSELSIGSLLCKSQVEALPTWYQPPDPNDIISWKHHLKTLLYEKASLVYVTLSEQEYAKESYASALRHIRMVLECRSHLPNSGRYEDGVISCLLGRAGDCYFQIAKQWNLAEQFRVQMSTPLAIDSELRKEMRKDNVQPCSVLSLLLLDIETKGDVLNSSWMCYLKALTLEPREDEKKNLQTRLGNICNELSSYYMQLATTELSVDEIIPRQKIEMLLAVASTHLDSGIKAFEEVKDVSNLALLYSNYGRLMRLMAFLNSEPDIALNVVAKSHYKKALSYYQSALTTLGSRRNNPAVWDTVFWEMSTTIYTFASSLQDNPRCDRTLEEQSREVLEYLTKAIKYCDTDTPTNRQPLYQYRAAQLHNRLASLYHRLFRMLNNDSSKKSKMLQLSLLHYEKALQLFSTLEMAAACLRNKIERAAVYDYQEECSTTVSKKIKNLETVLETLLSCEPFVQMLLDKQKGEKNDKTDGTKSECATSHLSEAKAEAEVEDEEREEEINLLGLLELRLQSVLRVLIKHCLCLQSQQKFAALAAKYKEMYSLLLKKNEKHSLEEHLLHVMRRVKGMM